MHASRSLSRSQRLEAYQAHSLWRMKRSRWRIKRTVYEVYQVHSLWGVSTAPSVTHMHACSQHTRMRTYVRITYVPTYVYKNTYIPSYLHIPIYTLTVHIPICILTAYTHTHTCICMHKSHTRTRAGRQVTTTRRSCWQRTVDVSPQPTCSYTRPALAKTLMTPWVTSPCLCSCVRLRVPVCVCVCARARVRACTRPRHSRASVRLSVCERGVGARAGFVMRARFVAPSGLVCARPARAPSSSWLSLGEGEAGRERRSLGGGRGWERERPPPRLGSLSIWGRPRTTEPASATLPLSANLWGPRGWASPSVRVPAPPSGCD